ncbi:hypothetical protein IIY66_00060 [Candidatus Saccharibacteria bacterium]|nr:hypothetical protein [Candidatus Saccharibacteria bacterium]
MKPRLFSKHPYFYKALVIFLYSLPILFSLFTFLFITTSGEDIFQGAGNLSNHVDIDVAQDAKNAFEFNSRITDIYAWTAIDFYDYQFKFGPDTILRIIDIVMVNAVFYLSTYLILSHKPKLLLKDALVFCTIFTAFIITPFGYTFYREFSMIHNYVPLALITLLFAIPYIKLITKQSIAKSSTPIYIFYMLVIGIIFGMSATITPLAFLITVIIYAIIRRNHLTKPPIWFYIGIIGTTIGFLICWLAGSGVDHYTSTSSTSSVFDYIPFSNIFTNIPKLFSHNLYNFALVIIPLLIVIVFCFIFLKNRKKLFSKPHLTHLSSTTINLALVFVLFIVIHILGASLIKSPPRLLIPAYLAGLIIVFRIFLPHLKLNAIFITIITASALVVVIVHTILIIKYHFEMNEVLNIISTSKESTICISPEDTKPTRIPLLDLSQANMIVDWGQPEPIYGKQILPCK